ncbi:MAG: zinc-binding alcohol dehydrogenase [Verrucomicrobiota bacterium]
MLVETEYSGISQGTEIWALTGKRPELQFPTVPGYQSIGRIQALGPSVTGFKPGQRVMVKSNRLPKAFPETWMGAHASHIVTKEAIPVPDACDPVGAAISALPAVSLRGIKMIDIRIGDVVVVVGQGLIGQFSAQFARLRGAVVVAADVVAERLALSQAHSADLVVNVKEQDLKTFVASQFPGGVDAVIETTGRADLFATCVDLLRWEGHLLLQGWYSQPISFNFHATHLKKPRVAVTCGFDFADTSTCLKLLEHRKLKLRELVSHVAPPSAAPDIYPQLAKNDPGFMGVVFDWTKA